MTWVVVGLLASVAAVVFGLIHDNAALMILGFVAFGLSMFAGDHAADTINNRASDSLRGAGFRVGYDKVEDRQW